MDPNTTPPWRVIDAAPAHAASDDDPPPTRVAPSLRLGLLVAGAALSVVIAFALAISGSGQGDVLVDGSSPFAAESAGLSANPVTDAELRVEVVGAVQRPGVYAVAAGSRVGDLVVAAGGYDPRVDTARVETELNLAAPVADGDRIRVPSRDDPATVAGPTNAPGGGAGGLVDLNTATGTELEALPGIGPVTAEKILTARDEAPFASVDDLRSRGLVGEKTFEDLKDLVTVG